MKTTVKPTKSLLHDRILVVQDEAKETTQGGIIIPDGAQEKPVRGTVIQVGPGKPNAPMVLNEGDRIVFGKYSGTEVELEGVEYKIMREDEVFAVLEGDVEKPLKKKK